MVSYNEKYKNNINRFESFLQTIDINAELADVDALLARGRTRRSRASRASTILSIISEQDGKPVNAIAAVMGSSRSSIYTLRRRSTIATKSADTNEETINLLRLYAESYSSSCASSVSNLSGIRERCQLSNMAVYTNGFHNSHYLSHVGNRDSVLSNCSDDSNATLLLPDPKKQVLGYTSNTDSRVYTSSVYSEHDDSEEEKSAYNHSHIGNVSSSWQNLLSDGDTEVHDIPSLHSVFTLNEEQSDNLQYETRNRMYFHTSANIDQLLSDEEVADRRYHICGTSRQYLQSLGSGKASLDVDEDEAINAEQLEKEILDLMENKNKVFDKDYYIYHHHYNNYNESSNSYKDEDDEDTNEVMDVGTENSNYSIYYNNRVPETADIDTTMWREETEFVEELIPTPFDFIYTTPVGPTEPTFSSNSSSNINNDNHNNSHQNLEVQLYDIAEVNHAGSSSWAEKSVNTESIYGYNDVPSYLKDFGLFIHENNTNGNAPTMARLRTNSDTISVISHLITSGRTNSWPEVILRDSSCSISDSDEKLSGTARYERSFDSTSSVLNRNDSDEELLHIKAEVQKYRKQLEERLRMENHDGSTYCTFKREADSRVTANATIITKRKGSFASEPMPKRRLWRLKVLPRAKMDCLRQKVSQAARRLQKQKQQWLKIFGGKAQYTMEYY